MIVAERKERTIIDKSDRSGEAMEKYIGTNAENLHKYRFSASLSSIQARKV